jgi:hypothetical protein
MPQTRNRRQTPRGRFSKLAKKYPGRVEIRPYKEPWDLPRTKAKAYPANVTCPFCGCAFQSSRNALNSVGAMCSTCTCTIFDGFAYMLWPPNSMVLERAAKIYKEAADEGV